MGAAIDLTGRWTGVYFYPADHAWNAFDDMPPTAFSAMLEDAAGLVTGTTSEEDVLGRNGGVWIGSVIQGRHDGRRLTFVKFTQSREGFGEPIHYDGDISSDGLSIEGRWDIPGKWSGPFRMQRQSGEVAPVAVERSETVDR